MAPQTPLNLKNWVSHPDQVDALISGWQQAHPGLLTVEQTTQFGGRSVWSVTVTDHALPAAPKRKALIYKPHAHEPAPLAAQMNFINQLLTGQTLAGEPTSLPRDRYLAETLLCFQPDANPAGTAAAPVTAWDGSRYTNQEFWAWMRGVDPDTGLMWKRVDLWDDTLEEKLPTRYGIVYEQVSEHEFVEPNRHRRSSLMRWLHRMLQRHTWDRLLDLHQTEFENSDRNCMVILPATYRDLTPERQELERDWSEALLQAWADTDGGRPLRPAEPLNYSGEQLQYFTRVFGDIYRTNNLVTTEVQNNTPATPPALQQRLCEVAIVATVEHMLRD